MYLRKTINGLTLLELMAVIAIISVLATLLIGGVSKVRAKAKDRVWRAEAKNGFELYIGDHLAKFYQSQTSYPSYTTKELFQRGVFDDKIMDFLQCPHVEFIPFSSSDSDEKIILQIDGYWAQGEKPRPRPWAGPCLQKKDATHPNNNYPFE